MNDGDALFADLYELTMLQAYFEEGLNAEAVFDLYIRSLPPQRNFLVACGLDQVLRFLDTLSFSPESVAYLASLGMFKPDFLDYLQSFRFTGQVRAVPEGTIVFEQEPLLEVKAPLPEAQLVETYLLNQVTFSTTIASKGARAMLAAQGRSLVDFGSRRAHGRDAALKAARALYITGYDATSNVLAGRLYGIPVAGTMAHSYIQAHDSESEAFRAFLSTYPETILLVDTYDTETGVRLAAKLVSEAGEPHLRGIRLDSGDLVELSKLARRVLDEAGLTNVAIYASGGLDEYEIESLVASGAPISAFGVGTSAVVSDDAPVLDSCYKLASHAGVPRIKLSPDKVTLPGAKQVYRRYQDGVLAGDVIALEGERLEGEPLLVEVMKDGERTSAGRETLIQARERLANQLTRLPPALKSLTKAERPYPVTTSRGLDEELRKAQERLSKP